jgi:hypothetical protein
VGFDQETARRARDREREVIPDSAIEPEVVGEPMGRREIDPRRSYRVYSSSYFSLCNRHLNILSKLLS